MHYLERGEEGAITKRANQGAVQGNPSQCRPSFMNELKPAEQEVKRVGKLL
jgi:hypothetical protein